MERPPGLRPGAGGPWEMRERLGAGGFGNVCLYQHRELDIKIAIKSCRLELSTKNRERWCHEIQMMKKLDHANIVKACDVPEELNFLINDVPLLAMEYCSGGDLRKAPELFENKPYTATVDYWSFGTMVFECIAGYRPFLHHLQPFTWHEKIKKKDPKCIFACEEMTGDVRFSSHLPQPNNLCSLIVEPMESWLQLMLNWDPQQRGGPIETTSKQPKCFVLMDHILNLKVGVIGYLEDQIMSLHTEIMELQKSPYGRRQGDLMESL
ncbi:Inhibitor of nuclear factor kappa-B kinase subunit alpha [Microtus ochrogaster]|uniref:Inhibitor of nuclear factor kappa-B kinase subunit alpha n=1 Tax=Microtus ochrogaster TaxID=79684 RepID=A0A8J6G5C2_MICOH|nr:Inhibitor of nuclear factor kappa-B kinase subunit alpha [Microtus ochrogaster]